MARTRGPRGPLERPVTYDRIPERPHHAYDGSKSLYSFALTLLLLLFMAAISARQVTSEAEAERLLQAGIATLTDVDVLVAENREPLRQLAENTTGPAIPFPGYPLAVSLTRQEAVSGTNAEIRSALLERSAAVVYADGLGAFDRTGEQSLGTFSTQGLLRLVVGQLSEKTHRRATIASIVLGTLAGLAALAVLAKNGGYTRLRVIGFASLGAAIPGAAIVFGVRLLAARYWSGDPFSEDLGDIVRAVVNVPLRNYLILGSLGVALAAAGIVFQAVAGRREAAEEDDIIGGWTVGPAFAGDDDE
jgi:hypothetical protein